MTKRRQIFHAVKHGARTSREIAERCGLTQAEVTAHLAQLAGQGKVLRVGLTAGRRNMTIQTWAASAGRGAIS